MRNFLQLTLENGDVVMFPCDEVVDVVGCEETLEVQVLSRVVREEIGK